MEDSCTKNAFASNNLQYITDEEDKEMTIELEKYYNKFCEDKRLTRKYGQVEYITSMKYIHEYLGNDGKAMQGTTLDLSRFSENTFDMTLIFVHVLRMGNLVMIFMLYRNQKIYMIM